MVPERRSRADLLPRERDWFPRVRHLVVALVDTPYFRQGKISYFPRIVDVLPIAGEPGVIQRAGIGTGPSQQRGCSVGPAQCQMVSDVLWRKQRAEGKRIVNPQTGSGELARVKEIID